MAATNRHIVIVTDEYDLSADAILLRLRELGHMPVRLHPRDFLVQSQFSLRFAGGRFCGKLSTPNRTIALEDIGSVWWRRPKPTPTPCKPVHWEPAYVDAEIRHALQGLWSSLECYWMSFPARIKAASWKPGQLRRAIELGFEVPRTLITTQPGEAREFYEQCNRRIVYKPFTGTSIAKPSTFGSNGTGGLVTAGPTGTTVKVVYTTLLNDATFNRCVETLDTVPCLLQEYVEKKSELRVTIIGDKIFAAEIDSQAQTRTRVDWRHYDVPMLMRKTTLPPDVAARCFALMRGYGLQYSAMDFILTPDGRYVFLESNPNGQCLFVEHCIPEYKLTDAIANCLIRGLTDEAASREHTTFAHIAG